jgi:hypothetical protein
VSLNHVQRAIIGAVSTSLGAIPAAYENEKFTKPSDAKWAEVFFMPNDPSVETLGAEGQDLTDGIVQINLNYPVGTGGAAARSDFENIRASFPAGARPAYNGQEAVILSCGRSPGRVVDGWYRVSITISWYALIPR